MSRLKIRDQNNPNTWYSIPAGVGVPAGGTTGQVLKKKSGTDYDTEWAASSDTVLPAVTASDNGKFLRVVNGAWAAVTVSSASGVSF